jgi:hypothetical protein
MGTELILKTPDDADLGPAMTALTEKQRRFVYALLHMGTANHTEAARAAGYECSTDNSMRVMAHTVAHNHRVQAAMLEESQRRMTAASTMAVSELVRIAHMSPDDKTKLKAIEMILNRTGLHAKSEHKVVVDDQRDDAAVAKRIALLAAELGLDPKKLLGSVGAPAVDATFEEVEKPDDEQW